MRRNATMHIQDCFGLSQIKACKFLAAARSTVRYVVSKTKDDQLLEAMESVFSKYLRAGGQMIYLILRKQDRSPLELGSGKMACNRFCY